MDLTADQRRELDRTKQWPADQQQQALCCMRKMDPSDGCCSTKPTSRPLRWLQVWAMTLKAAHDAMINRLVKNLDTKTQQEMMETARQVRSA
jgi:hypothetical protein